MIAFGVIFAIIGLLVAVLSVWYLARWAIGKKDAKPYFKKRFFLSVGAFIVCIVGTGIFGGMENTRKAEELGFSSSTEYLAAQKENIDNPEVWAAFSLERQAEIQALAEQERAAAELARAVAEEEAARTAAEIKAAEDRERAQEEIAAVAQAAADAEERAQEEAVITAQKAIEEEACRTEISCWGEKASNIATFSCPRHIERMARYDYEWTDGFLGVKFSHYRWQDIENGIVTVIGDKIKFQNGFGAWSNIIYECDINPLTDQVLDVRVSDGRL